MCVEEDPGGGGVPRHAGLHRFYVIDSEIGFAKQGGEVVFLPEDKLSFDAYSVFVVVNHLRALLAHLERDPRTAVGGEDAMQVMEEGGDIAFRDVNERCGDPRAVEGMGGEGCSDLSHV